MLSDHSGAKATNRIEMGIYILCLTFCLGVTMVCALLRFSFELFSDMFFFLDWLFHVSSFWTVWVRVGPCIVWFLLLLGLLQVWRSLKSTISPNSGLFWGGTFKISLAPHLTFSYQCYLFLPFWWSFFSFTLSFLGDPSCPKRPCSPEQGHFMDDILLFLWASWFVSCFVFSCALVSINLIVVVCW